MSTIALFSCIQKLIVSWLNKEGKMFLWILFLTSPAASAPADEYRAIVNEAEYLDASSLKQIVPSGFSPPKSDFFILPSMTDFIDEDLPSSKRMLEILKKGHTALGLTFNIYDDNHLEAAVAVFQMLLNVDDTKYEIVKTWARVHINADMFDYATRLASLYGNKFKNEKLLPPFIRKPNHFVNGEVMWKAMHLKLGKGEFNEDDATLNQYYRSGNVLTVNANYSGWNIPQNGCDKEINYFKEDVALNSYYYGVHLLHPFWMNNDELDQFNPRHAEQYYFTHKQLMARYQLEKEHLNVVGYTSTKDSNCDINLNSYNSYLLHDYGLPFPIKSSVKGEWNEQRAYLKSIDIAIRECITRRLLVDNGTAVPMEGEHSIDVLSKLIRANLDSPKTAKIVRSIYGYGANGYPVDKYNPAPSLLHFPHTSLRDQTYWHLLQSLLNYYTEYRQTLEPYSLANYDSKNFVIVDHSFSNFTTYFEYFKFSLNKGLGGGDLRSPLVFSARQRRLTHLPVTLNFTVDSTSEKEAVVRLFLGPQCDYYSCWKNYHRFFELDIFKTQLKYGLNTVSWSSEESKRFSSDDFYNMDTSKKTSNKYSIFKFPKNLMIPRGFVQGLNLTLFVMVTEVNNIHDNITPDSNSYMRVLNEVDQKPLGFPFHKQSIIGDQCTSNCQFYNITVYHEARNVDASGYFSTNLY